MKQEIVLRKFKIPGQANWLVRGLWIGGGVVVLLTVLVVLGLASRTGSGRPRPSVFRRSSRQQRPRRQPPPRRRRPSLFARRRRRRWPPRPRSRGPRWRPASPAPWRSPAPGWLARPRPAPARVTGGSRLARASCSPPRPLPRVVRARPPRHQRARRPKPARVTRLTTSPQFQVIGRPADWTSPDFLCGQSGANRS